MKRIELIGREYFELTGVEIINLINALEKINWKFKLKRNGNYWDILIEKEH